MKENRLIYIVGTPNPEQKAKIMEIKRKREARFGTTESRAAETKTRVVEPKKPFGGVQPTAPADTKQETPQQSQQTQPTQPVKEFSDTMLQQSEAYQESLKGMTEIMGDQMKSFQEQMDRLQRQTGMDVDITQPEFQEEIQQAMEKGEKGLVPVMRKYLTGEPTTMEQIGTLRDQAIAALTVRAITANPELESCAPAAYNLAFK